MRRWLISAWLVSLVLVPGKPANAQAPASTPLPGPASPTAEELRQLERSLGADATKTATTTDADPRPTAPADPAPARAPAPASLQSMNPDMSFIFDGAAAYFSDAKPPQMGGHDPNKVGFTLQQLELSIGAAVDPFFRFDGNIVFLPDEVEIEEAYGTTLALPYGLQARVGQFLTRFGRLNPTHPHAWDFMDQPLVLGKFFGGDGNRGMGSELSWLAPLPWYVELVTSVNEAMGECCARSFLGADDRPVRGLQDLLYTGALKQFFALSPDWSLLFGLSAQLGPNGSSHSNRSAIYGGDLTIKWRPLASPHRTAVTLQTEAMVRSRQVPNDRLQDSGGYAQLVWKITPRWDVGARYERMTGIAMDPLDPAWTGVRQRESTQITFYPSHFSRVRLQGNHDRPAWRDSAVFALMLNVELVTGAHGAHAF